LWKKSGEFLQNLHIGRNSKVFFTSKILDDAELTLSSRSCLYC